jgi:hypothetical protein
MLDLGFRQVGIGDSCRGICGGMVFAAEDYRRGGRVVPRNLDEAGVSTHIGRRLIESFNILRFVPLRIVNWMLRSDRYVLGRTVRWEWPRIQRKLRDHAEPVSLMLIKVGGLKLHKIGVNHQVLAYGYDEDPQTGQVVLHVYDPNHPVIRPEDHEVTLTFNVRSREEPFITHSREAEPIRGVFLNPYAFAVVPPG